METIKINNVDFTLNTEPLLSVEFNSDEANFSDPRLSPNGLKKRIEFESLMLRKDWTIETHVVVKDISPTGKVVHSTNYGNYISSENDSQLFKSQGGTLIESAILNGIMRYVLGNTRAVMGLDGSLINTQPIPIPDEA